MRSVVCRVVGAVSSGAIALLGGFGCNGGGDGGGGDGDPPVVVARKAPELSLGTALVRLAYRTTPGADGSALTATGAACYGLDMIACGMSEGCTWSGAGGCMPLEQVEPVVDVAVEVPRYVDFVVSANIATPAPESTGRQPLGSLDVHLVNNDLSIYNFATTWLQISTPTGGVSGQADSRFAVALYLAGQAPAAVSPGPGVPAAYGYDAPLSVNPALLRQWNKPLDYPLYPAWDSSYELVGGFPDNPLPAQAYSGELRLELRGSVIACASGADCFGSYECTSVDGGNYCMPGVCVPSCSGKTCGDDGCGGACGVCSAEQQCVEGACKTPKFIFVTNAQWTGALGGIVGADGKCALAAGTAMLPGTGYAGPGSYYGYKAWLSTQDYSPATHWSALREQNPMFRLRDGTLVASSWADLTDGTLAHAIDLTETGARLAGGDSSSVWTGTTAAGLFDATYAPGGDCGDWQDASVCYQCDMGHVGMATASTSLWTDWTPLNCGNYSYHLYCVQQ